MTIRTRLLICALLPIALAAATGIIALAAHHTIRTLRASGQTAAEVLKAVFELNILTHDYVRNRHLRAQQQWLQRHESLGDTLAHARFDKPETQALLADLRQRHATLRDTFALLVESNQPQAGTPAGRAPGQLQERVIGELEAASMRIVSDALRVSRLIDAEVAQARQRAFLLVVLSALAAACGVACFTGWIGRGIAGSIHVLRDGANQIAHGHLEHRIARLRGDELAGLAASFNDMASSLQISRAALHEEIAQRKTAQERVEHLNSVLRAVRNVNQLITQEKRRGHLLRSCCEKLIETRSYLSAWAAVFGPGMQLAEAQSAGMQDVFAPLESQLKKGDVPACARAAMERRETVAVNETDACGACALRATHEGQWKLAACMEHGGTLHGVLVLGVPQAVAADAEERLLVAEVCGDMAFALYSLNLEERRAMAEEELRQHRDHLERLVVERTAALEAANQGLQLEVAERQRTEEHLRRLTLDLQYSNKDLEQFAYSASHDLQEPLRKVGAFGTLLAQECRDALTAEGRQCLEYMLDGTERMRGLINDLLTYSRVATQGKAFGVVDLNATLRDVLSDLELRLREAGGTVDVEELPSIEADPTQMRQLFQNLIANALKFVRPGVPPRVLVRMATEARGGAPAADALCRISVEDNGIGFEQKYAERIFGIFQRLHQRHEYPGTGIGLAVCRRVVERHGGTIEAEGRPGEGAKFTIRLPLRHDTSTKERKA